MILFLLITFTGWAIIVFFCIILMNFIHKYYLYEKAKTKLRQVLEAKVNQRPSITDWNEGIKKLKEKDLAGALSNFNAAIEYSPNAAAFLARSIVKQQMNDKLGAIEDLDKAIELFPEFTSALLSRGKLKFQLKLYEEALIDLTKLIEIDPDYTDDCSEEILVCKNKVSS